MTQSTPLLKNSTMKKFSFWIFLILNLYVSDAYGQTQQTSQDVVKKAKELTPKGHEIVELHALPKNSKSEPNRTDFEAIYHNVTKKEIKSQQVEIYLVTDSKYLKFRKKEVRKKKLLGKLYKEKTNILSLEIYIQIRKRVAKDRLEKWLISEDDYLILTEKNWLFDQIEKELKWEDGWFRWRFNPESRILQDEILDIMKNIKETEENSVLSKMFSIYEKTNDIYRSKHLKKKNKRGKSKRRKKSYYKWECYQAW